MKRLTHCAVALSLVGILSTPALAAPTTETPTQTATPAAVGGTAETPGPLYIDSCHYIPMMC
ncbi:hypothetical protein SAMN05443377_1092 [Propionibacterium cyclohexanicum]|uniref:Uncharacterized protein n=1 Tax=Propionibacterium cyclohexanicum TaxID=64702 RepID=A0A1H9RSF5_9ACTN|nr:hypothetical protein [Propionibacterium cyclohexanicum]SER75587.1 hypothetical protein SAMN05443377_1092 [Propionibacterium cyclohexanicum]